MKEGSNSLILVPGLAESALAIYSDLLSELEKDSKKSLPDIYAVITHPDSGSLEPNELNPKTLPCIISPFDRKYSNFDSRVNLVKEAILNAKKQGADKIKIMGHSAGALATLFAVRDLLKSENHLPKLHLVLIAPAIPKDSGKLFVVEREFIYMLLGNILRSLRAFKLPYIAKILAKHDIDPEKADLRYILEPARDQVFMDCALERSVEISGKEAFDLIFPPRLREPGELWTKEDLQIDIIIPQEDRWVKRAGQLALARLLNKLTQGKAKEHRTPGGHLTLGRKDPLMKLLLDILKK